MNESFKIVWRFVESSPDLLTPSGTNDRGSGNAARIPCSEPRQSRLQFPLRGPPATTCDNGRDEDDVSGRHSGSMTSPTSRGDAKPGSLTPLAAALADRYRIERELGAGGMATFEPG